MLWAITSFFNPLGYRRRRENYQVFRRQLNLPLVAVELAYREFELQATDAEILVQLRGRDVMWQKERLLNVALQHLPPECTAVAWLDADVILDHPNWPVETCQMLDRYPLVQLFESAHDLPADFQPESTPLSETNSQLTGLSLVATCLNQGLNYVFDSPDFRSRSSRQRGFRSGMAWAGRVDLLRRHGFYDACIVGTGDVAFASAAYGWPAAFAEYLDMGPAMRRHYLTWANPLFADISGSVSYVPATLYHLWHGTAENRGHASRRQIAPKHDFSPADDLALDPSGCWRWNSNKPEFHREVAEYFRGRREDAWDCCMEQPVAPASTTP